MRHHLRRYTNWEYLYAHLHELPTRLEMLVIALCILCLGLMGYVYDAYRMRVEGADADAQRVRVLDACNHDKGLGSYTEKNGERFEVVCSFYERRVRT